MNSHHLQKLLASKQEGRRGLVGLALAIKCFSLEETHLTAFHDSWARTSHLTPSSAPKGTRSVIPSCAQQEEG